jgi:hypothetical protein
MPSPYPETAHGRLLAGFFSRLDDADVPYVVLRNWETLPDEPVGDVDVVTTNGRLAGRLLHEMAAKERFVPIRVARHTFHRIHALAPRSPLVGAKHVVVDIQPGSTHRRGISIPAARLIADRERSDGFWRPRPGREAAAMLLHCALDRGAMPPRYAARIDERAALDPEGFVSTLATVTGQDLARRALEAPERQLRAVADAFRGQPMRALLERTVALGRYRRGPGPLIHTAPGVKSELESRGVRTTASRVEARRRLGVVVQEDGTLSTDEVLEICRREYT